MNLPDLIAKLEKLEGPNRAVDWEIHCRNGLQGVGMYGNHPHYTSSMDSAFTLAPERWVSLRFEQHDNGLIGCFLGATDTVGATPAIALCIAALCASAAA